MRRFLLLGTTLLFCHYASCSVYDESLLPSDRAESGGDTSIGGSTGGVTTGGGGSGGTPSGGTSSGGMSTGGGTGGDMTGTGATTATGGNGDGGSGGNDNGETGGNGNGTGGNGDGGSGGSGTGGSGTGGSGGSGGSSGGSGGTPPTFTYEYTAIATMENGEERIELQGGGYWFTASATTPACISPHGMGDVEPVFLDEPRSLSGYPVTSSALAMHVTTDGCSGWGSQIGFGLQAGDTEGSLDPYDASEYDGIAFWARADSTERRIRLEVADVYTNPWGGICEEDDNGPCHDNFRSTLMMLTGSWQLYRVRFASMTQGGHGHASPNTSPDTSQLFQVVFSFTQSNHGNVDYWIDDIYFFKEIPDD